MALNEAGEIQENNEVSDEIPDSEVVQSRNGYNQATDTFKSIVSKFAELLTNTEEIEDQIASNERQLIDNDLSKLPDDQNIRNYFLFLVGHPEMVDLDQVNHMPSHEREANLKSIMEAV